MAETKLSPTARGVPIEWVLDYLAALQDGLSEIDAQSRKRVLDFAETHCRRRPSDDARPEDLLPRGHHERLHTSFAHQVYKHGARSCQAVFDQNLAANSGTTATPSSLGLPRMRPISKRCRVAAFLSDASTGGCACPLIAHRHVSILDPLHTNRCECTAAWVEMLFEKFPGGAVRVEVKSWNRPCMAASHVGIAYTCRAESSNWCRSKLPQRLETRTRTRENRPVSRSPRWTLRHAGTHQRTRGRIFGSAFS